MRDIKYFWFKETELEGIPVAVQRSGWSKQGGFEIYLRDGSKGARLWNIFKEAGKPWGIGPGAPATAERYESGLVSVGGDTDGATNPFEIRLGKYVDLDIDDRVVGIDRPAADRPRRPPAAPAWTDPERRRAGPSGFCLGADRTQRPHGGQHDQLRLVAAYEGQYRLCADFARGRKR